MATTIITKKKQAEELEETLVNAFRNSLYNTNVTLDVCVDSFGNAYTFEYVGLGSLPYRARTGEHRFIQSFAPNEWQVEEERTSFISEYGAAEFVKSFTELGMKKETVPEFEAWITEKYKEYYEMYKEYYEEYVWKTEAEAEEIYNNPDLKTIYEDEEFIDELDFQSFKTASRSTT